jgi:hypothetical protein
MEGVPCVSNPPQSIEMDGIDHVIMQNRSNLKCSSWMSTLRLCFIYLCYLDRHEQNLHFLELLCVFISPDLEDYCFSCCKKKIFVSWYKNSVHRVGVKIFRKCIARMREKICPGATRSQHVILAGLRDFVSQTSRTTWPFLIGSC